MTMRLNPYLNFRDEARAAMEHYRSVFGGELTWTTFGEANFGEDGATDKIMHAMLQTEGLVLMAADTPSGVDYEEGTAIAVSLSGDDEAALTRYWDGLTDGGTVVEPLAQAPWGDSFGMCVDRFGVTWLVDITTETDGG